MTLQFTAITFSMFVLYIELTEFRIWLDSIKTEINRTFGRADNIYKPNRSAQSWMRTNTIQNYK